MLPAAWSGCCYTVHGAVCHSGAASGGHLSVSLRAPTGPGPLETPIRPLGISREAAQAVSTSSTLQALRMSEV